MISQNAYNMGIQDSIKHAMEVRSQCSRPKIDQYYIENIARILIRHKDTTMMENITGHKNVKGVFIKQVYKTKNGTSSLQMIVLEKTLTQQQKRETLALMYGYYLYTLNHGNSLSSYAFVSSDDNKQTPTDFYATGASKALEKHIKFKTFE